MLESPSSAARSVVRRVRLFDAIAFYTSLPIPACWLGDFSGVARAAPLVGILIGGGLSSFDWGLQVLGMPTLTRSALLAIAWVGVTGGLHLDGAMDTADGLAVSVNADAEALLPRRLQAMSDSATGAFGAMAAIALLLLKTAALCDLTDNRWLALLLAAGWGRWGQQVAIVRYAYLKPTGKGAFHKAALRSTWDLLPGLLLLSGICAASLMWGDWLWSLGAALGGGAIAAAAAAWFNRQLGGHTGDTYGAVVEWTEALFLVLLTVL